MNGPRFRHVGTGSGALVLLALILLRDNAGLVVAEEAFGVTPLAAVFLGGWLNRRFGPKNGEPT